jgi:hypothetical protein
MASKIDEKYAALKAAGFDLGQPTSAEQDAGYGGTYRSYQNGNIYWHPVMGDSAHEVHGGILSLYLSRGGPGVNPASGLREYGFPLSDELRSPLDNGQTPYSTFETGAIYWTQGTGGVVLYGDVYKGYQQNINGLGLPVSSATTIWIGFGLYCERGIVWTCPGLNGFCFAGFITPPLMGIPVIVQAGQATVDLGPLIEWPTPGNDLTEKLGPNVPPEALSMVWKNRLTLSPVGGGTDVWLNPSDPNLDSMTSLETAVPISLSTTAALQDSKLYDLKLHPPVGEVYNLSPHCVYAKTSWDNFGLFHITDIHLSLRNQQLRDALAHAGMADAAQHYSNCQECFRDFIKYANHLHSIGLADAIMATGDLIDYVAEPSDNKYLGNYVRLRRMILGQPFDSGVPAYDELQIPIFLTFGNHDYRLNRFVLNFNIDVNLYVYEDVVPMDEYSTFNITPDEAVAAQGGPIKYGLSDFNKALAMLQYDDTGGAYAYFSKYFSPRRTFIVDFGANRLVMLDNGWDAGVPQISGWTDLVKFLYEYETGNLSRATDCAVNGTIDASGLDHDVLLESLPALSQASQNGVVIVGMHVPPFSPVNSEFPYYLRETVHPTTDPALTQEYLSRNSFKTDGWTNNGTPYFRIGEIGNGHGLDNGVISEYGMDFVRLLAGVGAEVTRPVDLFLCGHHHQRMEYRLKWNGSDVQFYMDFYMESPSTYYSTTAPKDFSDGHNTLKKGEPIAIKIDPAAPATGSFSTTIAQENTPQGPLSEVRGTMSLPPYSDTLDATKDPKTWWQNHRPIVAQTAALGPIDPRQRFDPRWEVTYTFLPGSPFAGQPPITVTVESKTQPKPSVLPEEVVAVRRIMTAHPDPTFNGFRFIQVEGNIIQKGRYINLADLRAANFTLPWEPIRTGPIRPDPIRVDPAKLTTEG